MSAWSKHVIKIRVSTKKEIIIYGHYFPGIVEQIEDAGFLTCLKVLRSFNIINPAKLLKIIGIVHKAATSWKIMVCLLETYLECRVTILKIYMNVC